MPYKYKKIGDKYCVYKKGTNEKVGCTKGTKKALDKYLAALRINSNEKVILKFNESRDYLLDVNEYLSNYKEGVNVLDIQDLNEEEEWFIDQMKSLIDELNKYNIDSKDFLNESNLGLKPSGELGFFDIGFGDFWLSDDKNITKFNVHNELLGYQKDIITNIGDKILKRMNIKDHSMMDFGSNGVSYDIKNGKVLKITTDITEAYNSRKLIGKENKHLSNIYHVYKVKGSSNLLTDINKNVYMIILEMLDTSIRRDLIEVKEGLNRKLMQSQSKHIDKSEIDKIPNDLIKNIILKFISDGHKKTYDYIKGKFGEKWYEVLDFLEKDINMSFDDLYDISEWVKNSKTNDNYVFKDVPDFIISSLEKLQSYNKK